MERREINAADAVTPVGGYAQAIEIRNASRTLYISGQIPADIHGAVPDTFAEQAKLVWQNIEAQLRAAGMTFDNLVKVTYFLTSRDYLQENRAVRDATINGRTTASSLVIGGLANPAWLIEIEAVAAA